MITSQIGQLSVWVIQIQKLTHADTGLASNGKNSETRTLEETGVVRWFRVTGDGREAREKVDSLENFIHRKRRGRQKRGGRSGGKEWKTEGSELGYMRAEAVSKVQSAERQCVYSRKSQCYCRPQHCHYPKHLSSSGFIRFWARGTERVGPREPLV